MHAIQEVLGEKAHHGASRGPRYDQQRIYAQTLAARVGTELWGRTQLIRELAADATQGQCILSSGIMYRAFQDSNGVDLQWVVW